MSSIEKARKQLRDIYILDLARLSMFYADTPSPEKIEELFDDMASPGVVSHEYAHAAIQSAIALGWRPKEQA